MKDETNQDLVNLLKSENGTPVYVQLGLNPNYVQFHSPSAEDPITAGYWKPSYAGVLTGYDFMNDKEFWEVYIRRHKYSDNVNNNYVRVGAVFEKKGMLRNPFAAISSMAVSIDVPDEYHDSSSEDGNKVIEFTKDRLSSVKNQTSFEALADAIISESQGKPDQLVQREDIETVIIYLEPLLTNGVNFALKDVFNSIKTLVVDDEMLYDGWMVFSDFWDSEYVYVTHSDFTGHRLDDNIVLKDVTVTGKLKVLSFGVNSARYNNLIVRGKRSYSH